MGTGSNILARSRAMSAFWTHEYYEIVLNFETKAMEALPGPKTQIFQK